MLFKISIFELGEEAMSKFLTVIILSFVVTTAVAVNPMVEPAFLAHFQDTTSWNLSATLGDFSWSSDPNNWLLESTASTMTPAHIVGFIGNGTTGGVNYYSYDWSFSGRPASSIIDVNSFAAGVWVKLDTIPYDGYQRVQQILLLQGSRTSEYLKIDYSALHEDRIRICWSGGGIGDPEYTWETSRISTIGTEPWVYIAASYVQGDGVTADAVVPYVFDSTGTLISGGSGLIGGYWYAEPLAPLCGDSEYRLNAGIIIGTNHPAVALSPLSVDEVSIQGYLTEAQIQNQVTLMVAGQPLIAATGPVCGDQNHIPPTMDFTGDCKVNFDDFAQFAAQWLNCTAPVCN